MDGWMKVLHLGHNFIPSKMCIFTTAFHANLFFRFVVKRHEIDMNRMRLVEMI